MLYNDSARCPSRAGWNHFIPVSTPVNPSQPVTGFIIPNLDVNFSFRQDWCALNAIHAMPRPDAVKLLFDASRCGTRTIMFEPVRMQLGDRPCRLATTFASILVHKHELILVDLTQILRPNLGSLFTYSLRHLPTCYI